MDLTSFFVYLLPSGGRGASLGRKESIHERDPEVKRYMSSLCNVQKNKKQKNKKKIEQVKPKMMFLVFFYNVVLLAFLLL